MDWKTMTLSDLRRLLVALQKASDKPDEFIAGIIAREPMEVIPHGRVTIESLLTLLGQTNGSTILPEEIVALLNRTEPLPPAPPPAPPPAVAHVIDCDAAPRSINGKVKEHANGGQLTWDINHFTLYRSERQCGNEPIHGHKLLQEMRGQATLNANVADYLLDHQELIPKKWKGSKILFWGTIFHHVTLRGDRPCIRYICWGRNNYREDRWLEGYKPLDEMIRPDEISLVRTDVPVVTPPPLPVHMIDCTTPYKFEHFFLTNMVKPIVALHQNGGRFSYDPGRVGLYQDPQQLTDDMATGEVVMAKLQSHYMFPLDANVLMYLYEHEELIPETWKGKTVFFFGTVYQKLDGSRVVPYLHWHTWGVDRGNWQIGYRALSDKWGMFSHAAIRPDMTVLTEPLPPQDQLHSNDTETEADPEDDTNNYAEISSENANTCFPSTPPPILLTYPGSTGVPIRGLYVPPPVPATNPLDNPKNVAGGEEDRWFGDSLRRRIVARARRRRRRMAANVLPVQPPKHVIDCDAEPRLNYQVAGHTYGIYVDRHIPGGQFVWDPDKVRLQTFPSGDRPYQCTAQLPVLNANVLDWLLENQENIPEEWKGKEIYFWGTTYRHPQFNNGVSVRCLSWDVNGWRAFQHWINDDLEADSRAAVRIDLPATLVEKPAEPPIEHVIDCDAAPKIGDDFFGEALQQIKVDRHIPGGKMIWDKDRVCLHLFQGQAEEGISGWAIYRLTENKPVLNANVLDYLLEHQELIPQNWKGKKVYFWGTTYRLKEGAVFVRCLFWANGKWCSANRWNNAGFFEADEPAAWR